VRVEDAQGRPVSRGTVRAPSSGGVAALGERPTALPEGGEAGFEVEAAGARVRRAALSRAARGPLVLRLPPAAPAALPPLVEREVVVLGGDGAPVAGAHVEVTAPGGVESSAETDGSGRTRLPAREGTLRICASAEGEGETCVHAVARGGALEVRLPGTVRVRTEFRDPETGEPLRARALRIVSEDGTVRPLPVDDEGAASYSEETPGDLARTQALEVVVAGRPPVRVPLDEAAAVTPVPRGREVEVVARDAEGRPVEGARVVAAFSASVAPESASSDPAAAPRQEAVTDARGRATVAFPVDRDGVVWVEPEGAAPASAEAPAGGPAEVAFALVPGVRLEAEVLGPDGRPVPGADVVVLARAGRVPVRRRAATGPDGRAALPPVEGGTAEVYAHAPGFAWGFARVEAKPGAAPVVVRLEPGRRLQVVVEDPAGVPLAGVRVRAVAREDDARGRPEASGPDERPWTTDASGALRVEDLPDRPLDLWLSKPGFLDATLVRVRPGETTWLATMLPE
jgi:hypothetical protein